MPVDIEDWPAYVAKIEKRYGKGMVRDGTRDPVVRRISTRSHELDHICGGGIPIGRFTRLYGGYMSSKSLTCWNIVRSCHEYRSEEFPKGLEVVYYNLEKQYDKVYVGEKLGIDVKRLKIVDAETVEDCGTLLHDGLDVAHVHIIDSCSAVPCVDELAKDLDQHTMGLHPKVWGRVLRRTLKKMDRAQNAIVLVDQIRDVFGSGGQAPPGGRQMEHVSSLSLMFRRGLWLGRNADGELDPDVKFENPMSGQREAAGMEIQIRCEKSRVCRPLRAARLRLDLTTGLWDLPYELTKAGLYFDAEGRPAHETGKQPLIETTGPGRYVLDDGSKVHGMKKLRRVIEQDNELTGRITTAMMLRG